MPDFPSPIETDFHIDAALASTAIPLEEAIKQAAYWRTYCKNLLDGKKDPNGNDLPVMKAFFVPLDDLHKVLHAAKHDSGKELAGLRIYFRLESEKDDLSNLKAMVVPVIYEGALGYLKDWTHKRNTTMAEESSLVFDFTKPCPTECDAESPLSQEPN